MLRWGVGTLTLTLLDAAGQALTAALPADGVVSCVGLSGLRLTVVDAAPGAALRCGFLGVSSDHTWESWAQGPRLPAPGALTLEGLPSREHREPLRSHAELLDPDGVLIVLQPLSAAQAQRAVVVMKVCILRRSPGASRCLCVNMAPPLAWPAWVRRSPSRGVAPREVCVML